MFNRSIPDYIGNREHANTLVTRLKDYYHGRGYKDVRVWIEPELLSSGRKIYGVRSNIVFDVRKIRR